jgi:hypothetical protein
MTNASLLIVPDRFKASKLYSQLPQDGSGDFVVTRATTAFRTNENGILESVASGVPRLDFPIGSGCPALLVEPAATNLALRSEEFSDAYWTKAGLTVSGNTDTAPNNTTTADKIIIDNGVAFSATATYCRTSALTLTTGIVYNISVFAKDAGFNRMSVRMSTATTMGAGPTISIVVDLITGLQTGGTIGTYIGRTPAANGYFRYVFQTTSIASATNYLAFSVNDSVATQGNGVDGISIWGAQLETGSVATSYIPTVAATATRNADVISKTAVSGLIGQTAGTLYAEVDIKQLPALNARTFIDVGSSGNRVFMGFTSLASNTLRFQIDAGVGGVACVDIRTVVANAGIIKVAVAYQSLNCALYVNGVQATSIQSNIAFSFTTALSALFLGSTVSASAFVNDRIRAVALYTTRLTDSELAALTT